MCGEGMVYAKPSFVVDAVRNDSGIKGISNDAPTCKTSQKSCVGTAGSEGDGAKGLAVCLPIAAGMGRETHSTLASQYSSTQVQGIGSVTHLISPRARVIVSPSKILD